MVHLRQVLQEHQVHHHLLLLGLLWEGMGQLVTGHLDRLYQSRQALTVLTRNSNRMVTRSRSLLQVSAPCLRAQNLRRGLRTRNIDNSSSSSLHLALAMQAAA